MKLKYKRRTPLYSHHFCSLMSPHSLNASNKLRHPVIIQTPAPANEWRSVLHYYLKGDAINGNNPLYETILYHILHHVETENPSLRMAWVHWTTPTHPVTRINGNNVDPLFVQTYPTIRTIVDILGLYSVTPSTQADEHLPSKWGQFLKMRGSFNMLNTREAAIVQANGFHKLLGGSRSLANWETPLTITHSIFMSCAATKTPTTNSEQIVNLRRQHKKINYFSLQLFLITEHFIR